MKKYDSKLRKWVTEEQYQEAQSKRSKKVCRGGKPHDFVLVLPDHVSFEEGKYKFNPEKYYEIMDAEKDFFEKQSDKLENMGVVSRYSRLGRSETRVYMCAVCKKKKYEYPEN